MLGAVFDWYTSNTKIDYPFDSRQSDGMHEIFVDAYIIHNKERTRQSRLKIAQFDVTSATKTLRLEFEDGQLLAALTSASDTHYSTVFGNYTIFTWKRSTTNLNGTTDEDIVATIVMLTSAIPSGLQTLAQGYLLASLVNPRIKRVRRIGVAIGGSPCCDGWVTSPYVVFESGNNMQITEIDLNQPAQGLGILPVVVTRKPRKIQLDVIPGAGTGKFNDCNSSLLPIRTINNVGPDSNGNLQLEGRDCVWVERLVLSTGGTPYPGTNYRIQEMYDSQLQLHQDCDACCSCQDYGDAYTALARIWDRAKVVADRVKKLTTDYERLRQMMAGRHCKVTGLQIMVRVITRPDFHLSIHAYITNNLDYDVGASILRFTLSPTYEYVTRSGILEANYVRKTRYDPQILPSTELQIGLAQIQKQGWIRYTFEVRYPSGLGNVPGDAKNATGTLYSPAGTVSDSDAESLQKPLVKY